MDKMVNEINNGDVTAFERYSRWDILMADKAGEFIDIKQSNQLIAQLILFNEDSCLESL